MKATAPYDRKRLDACETLNDANNFFNNLHIEDLIEYVIFVKASKKYVSLTMRDDFLLQVADSIQDLRMSPLDQDEWLESVNRQESISKEKFNRYCESREAARKEKEFHI